MSDDLIAVKATEPDQTPDESIPGSSLPDESESPGQILNPSESASPPDSPRQNADDYRFNQNMVFLRGVIRGIRQELDPEDRQSNVVTVTTPNPLAGNQVETGLLDVYWGSNSRAGSLLSDFKVGDALPQDSVSLTAESLGTLPIAISSREAGSGGIAKLFDQYAQSLATGMDVAPDRYKSLYSGGKADQKNDSATSMSALKSLYASLKKE